MLFFNREVLLSDTPPKKTPRTFRRQRAQHLVFAKYQGQQEQLVHEKAVLRSLP